MNFPFSGNILYLVLKQTHILIFQPNPDTMKSYALVILNFLFLAFISCDGPKTSTTFKEDPCKNFPQWDKIIPNDVADLMLRRWQEKWDYPDTSPYHEDAEAIPDSFFVYFAALEEFTIGYCGFRVYYGLTEPGKISSLGLIITAINNHYGDILDTVKTDNRKDIYFTTATRPSQIISDSLETYNKFIDLATAQRYTSNWRCYNGVSRNNDSLGIIPCNVDRQIPPEGDLNSSYPQRIPLGNAFGPADSVYFRLLGGGYHSFEAFVLYNSFTIENESIDKQTLIQDFYMRGYGQIEKDGPFEIGNLAIDVTGHCPPICNRENALQGN